MHNGDLVGRHRQSDEILCDARHIRVHQQEDWWERVLGRGQRQRRHFGLRVAGLICCHSVHNVIGFRCQVPNGDRDDSKRPRRNRRVRHRLGATLASPIHDLRWRRLWRRRVQNDQVPRGVFVRLDVEVRRSVQHLCHERVSSLDGRWRGVWERRELHQMCLSLQVCDGILSHNIEVVLGVRLQTSKRRAADRARVGEYTAAKGQDIRARRIPHARRDRCGVVVGHDNVEEATRLVRLHLEGCVSLADVHNAREAVQEPRGADIGRSFQIKMEWSRAHVAEVVLEDNPNVVCGQRSEASECRSTRFAAAQQHARLGDSTETGAASDYLGGTGFSFLVSRDGNAVHRRILISFGRDLSRGLRNLRNVRARCHWRWCCNVLSRAELNEGWHGLQVVAGVSCNEVRVVVREGLEAADAIGGSKRVSALHSDGANCQRAAGGASVDSRNCGCRSAIRQNHVGHGAGLVQLCLNAHVGVKDVHKARIARNKHRELDITRRNEAN
mmetsp:Transcript_146273/g.354996  ORF Transcript_146273/g.354996 Transcript_146273/m.354996 type:complete len:499 (+) Transcript_146273:3012-4508(+)